MLTLSVMRLWCTPLGGNQRPWGSVCPWLLGRRVHEQVTGCNNGGRTGKEQQLSNTQKSMSGEASAEARRMSVYILGRHSLGRGDSGDTGRAEGTVVTQAGQRKDPGKEKSGAAAGAQGRVWGCGCRPGDTLALWGPCTELRLHQQFLRRGALLTLGFGKITLIVMRRCE